MKLNIVTILLLCAVILGFGCSSNVPESDFTLQLLHFADVDGNEETALTAVEYLSALVDGFKADSDFGGNTLLVSSGDNIIPGPRFYAAEQKTIRLLTGSNEPGHADIAFLNALGVQASALGNHELDAGPGELVDALSAEDYKEAAFPGALFPYLAANIDFSGDEDTAALMGTAGATVEQLAGKFASSAIVNIQGEKIGLVGASTPLLPAITTSGALTVTPLGVEWTAVQLAAAIQPAIDGLTADGVDKIILLSHMQQLDVEKALAAELTNVDIIVAGGSNTRMGDLDDNLYPGDNAFDEAYPFTAKAADDAPVLIVNVDGDYKYLGRLVVGFTKDGIVIPESVDTKVSGVYASTADITAAMKFSANENVLAIRDAVNEVITAQFGNVIGYTSVYLDGRRSMVRTGETNLGNLTADANLWYANQLGKEAVAVSIKNGGGIRTEIGAAIVPPGSVDYSEATLVPPVANEAAGTLEGAVSEGHMRATLRFDNGLVTLSATPEELKMLLEHGVSRTASGVTPGQFPQVGGMRFTFDPGREPGSRIQSLEILNKDGGVKDVVVKDGVVNGNANRRFRLVTLNFLANGGDGYPFDALSAPERRNLYEGKGYGEENDYPDENLLKDPGLNSSFSYTGGEQDAIAEYLMKFHGTKDNAYNKAEGDGRIKF